MTKIADATNNLLRAMGQATKGPKPEGATSIYTVCWCLRSDTFDGMLGRVSSSPTPRRLDKHKTFVSKDKAEALLKDIQEAFKTLGYSLEGYSYIEEDWYE